MNTEVVEVLRGLVSDSILDLVKNDFDEIADTDVLELGVDSIAIMEIVIRIEEICKTTIDYEKFEIDDIKTPSKIKRLISKIKNLE